MTTFEQKVKALRQQHEALLTRRNELVTTADGNFGTFRFSQNGIYEKYRFPVLTAEHIPLEWRYDFSEKDNPFLMQRIMMNAVFNAGAVKLDGRYLLVCRVEGADRKSFFAVAESPNGIDNFRFWEEPLTMPEAPELSSASGKSGGVATNIYDMRITQHEDGWITVCLC